MVDTEEGVPAATELRGNVVLAIAVLALAVFTGEDAEWMEISKDIGKWEGIRTWQRREPGQRGQ